MSAISKRLDAIERRLSTVEQERVTVIIERRDLTGEGGPDSAVLIIPGQRPQTIQRDPAESFEAFRVRADL